MRMVRDLWDNIRHVNIYIIEVPEGEEREKGTENLLEEVIAEIFPILVKQRHSSPGSTESPKYDERKETHRKT